MNRRLALLAGHPIGTSGAALLACALGAAALDRMALAERLFLLGAGIASFSAIQLSLRRGRWLHQARWGSGRLRLTWRLADAVAAGVSGGTIGLGVFLAMASLLTRLVLPPDPRHGHAYALLLFGGCVGVPLAVIAALAAGTQAWRTFAVEFPGDGESLTAPAVTFYLLAIGAAAAVCAKLDDPARATISAVVAALAFTTGTRLWRARPVAIITGTFTGLALVVTWDDPVRLFVASSLVAALVHASWRITRDIRRRTSEAVGE